MAALLLARTRPSSSLRLLVSSQKSSISSASRVFIPKLPLPATSPFPALRKTPPTMPLKKDQQNNGIASKEGNGHQFQAGTSDDDAWKHKEPYRIHGTNEEFETKWRGRCHCGRVEYQLSREVPLDAKYCHCTTCQRLHGVSSLHLFPLPPSHLALTVLSTIYRHHSNGLPSSINPTSTLPMASTTLAGTNLPKNPSSINCPAKCPAPSVARPLWMRAAT
jgi:hypothetical protein